MIITIIFADPIVKLVFGSKYIQSIPIFQALTLAMIPFLLGVITTTPLIYSLNQPKFTSRITILQVLIIIGLDLVLIPRFQALGPVISLGIANTTILVLSGWKLYSLLK